MATNRSSRFATIIPTIHSRWSTRTPTIATQQRVSPTGSRHSVPRTVSCSAACHTSKSRPFFYSLSLCTSSTISPFAILREEIEASNVLTCSCSGPYTPSRLGSNFRQMNGRTSRSPPKCPQPFYITPTSELGVANRLQWCKAKSTDIDLRSLLNSRAVLYFQRSGSAIAQHQITDVFRHRPSSCRPAISIFWPASLPRDDEKPQTLQFYWGRLRPGRSRNFQCRREAFPPLVWPTPRHQADQQVRLHSWRSPKRVITNFTRCTSQVLSRQVSGK